jgi:hypothetical protein
MAYEGMAMTSSSSTIHSTKTVVPLTMMMSISIRTVKMEFDWTIRVIWESLCTFRGCLLTCASLSFAVAETRFNPPLSTSSKCIEAVQSKYSACHDSVGPRVTCTADSSSHP